MLALSVRPRLRFAEEPFIWAGFLWEELVPQVVRCLLASPSLYSLFNNIRSLRHDAKEELKCIRTIRFSMDVFYEFKFCGTNISGTPSNAV